jgi:hypothetical protein
MKGQNMKKVILMLGLSGKILRAKISIDVQKNNFIKT